MKVCQHSPFFIKPERAVDTCPELVLVIDLFFGWCLCKRKRRCKKHLYYKNPFRFAFAVKGILRKQGIDYDAQVEGGGGH